MNLRPDSCKTSARNLALQDRPSLYDTAKCQHSLSYLKILQHKLEQNAVVNIKQWI